MFACLLMVVAVALCADLPKPPELPKDAAQGAEHRPELPRRDQQMPQRPEGPHQDMARGDGRPELPKGETPKPDAKPPQKS